MSFLSFSFAGFVVLALFFYEVLPQRFKAPFLLAASCFFYGLSGVKALLLLLFSAAVFFTLGERMEKAGEGGKRRCLIFGILFQFSILFFFKTEASFKLTGLDVLLPLGISYYTFKLAGYLLNIYWGKEKPEPSFIAFANHVAFFPQIVCGPIQKSRDFLAQMKGSLGTSPEWVSGGLRLILCGLFKKLVVSDILSDHIALLMNRSPEHVGLGGWVTVYCIPLQIYADFSGITDIAMGLGRIFGFQSPRNFSQPFYAPNIQEFWRRWHITLTDWIREYLFTPLQIFTRDLGKAGLVISLSVTMIAIGVWHGVAWNWLAFGLLHAFYLSASVLTLSFRNAFFRKHAGLGGIRPVVGALITYHMVLLSFVFFKVSSWGDFLYVLGIFARQTESILRHVHSASFYRHALRSGFDLGLRELATIVGIVGMMEAIHLFQNSARLRDHFRSMPAYLRLSVYLGLIVSIAWLGRNHNLEFTYSLF
ncbi:MAG: hypothetical protein A3A86_04770 [Elusimicrobia bacterium RIFCSPLOWO2_01_FULL_60_11]|nr:MAG: hypothetical protein A3A86_04770 [Elusimicrobia bacterium RIFCSPLOWO2_01_FULL_60_11]